MRSFFKFNYRYTQMRAKVGFLARQLRRFLDWKRQGLSEQKARMKAKHMVIATIAQNLPLHAFVYIFYTHSKS